MIRDIQIYLYWYGFGDDKYDEIIQKVHIPSKISNPKWPPLKGPVEINWYIILNVALIVP